MMEAGRVLDALIAEKVFGLPVRWAQPPYVELDKPRVDGVFPYLYGQAHGVEYNWGRVLHYSTDIAAAWLVVERVTRIPQTHAEAVRAANTRFAYWWKGADLWAYSSAEAALAICLAALEAVKESTP